MRNRETAFTATKLKSLLLNRPLSQSAWIIACSPTIQLRIGNVNATVTQDSALRQLTMLLNHVESFSRSYCDVLQKRNTITLETDVAFLDGKFVRLVTSCVVIGRLAVDLLVDLRFYLDTRPLPNAGDLFQLGNTPFTE
jgi:hypothetical protein